MDDLVPLFQDTSMLMGVIGWSASTLDGLPMIATVLWITVFHQLKPEEYASPEETLLKRIGDVVHLCSSSSLISNAWSWYYYMLMLSFSTAILGLIPSNLPICGSQQAGISLVSDKLFGCCLGVSDDVHRSVLFIDSLIIRLFLWSKWDKQGWSIYKPCIYNL